MSGLKNTKSNRQPGAVTWDVPSWRAVSQPRVHGVATFEWDVVKGTAWYSEEWNAISQSDDYDWFRPNAADWWTSRVHPEDLPVLERACLAVLAGLTENSDVTYRLKRGDGEWIWLHSRAQVAASSPSGSPLLVCGVCMDVTALYEGCDSPRSRSSVSDFAYHSMLESSPDLFVRLDRSLNPVYVNPVVSKYLGRTQEEVELTDTMDNLRISGAYKEMLRRNAERVFRDKAVVRETLSFTLSDGEEIFGECSFWPESGPDGKVLHAMVQFRDFTEKRRMEQRILLNEQRLEALYKLTCMEKASEEEVLRFVLDSVLKLTKSRSGFIFLPEENDLEKGLLLWSDDHYAFLQKHQLPDDHLPADLLMQMMSADGEQRYRSINNGDGRSPLYVVFEEKMHIMRGIIAPGMEDGRIVCIAGVCNKETDYDESELQQLETFINSAWLILRRRRSISELQHAKEAAEAANKAKNAFLANVSHELRTPLNGVLGMLQLMTDMPMEEMQRQYLLVAQSSGRALLRIISDLLDFSCMESGRMSLGKELFDCKASIRSAVSVFEDNAAQKGLALTCAIDPAIPPYLLGDENRVGQIIFNMVGNAIKFTQQGTISVTCACLEETKDGRQGIVITVADTGIGIPSESLPNIFEAFTQIENSQRGKFSGTGLGLSIVKCLATMMGGSVSVQSTADTGTVFRCTLFFDLPLPEQVRHKPLHDSGMDDSRQPLDILVAEDDQVGSFAIRSFLQRGGHRVVCVEDGKQALEALQLHPFHCLFTDIAMPRVDGIELVRRIRSSSTDGFPPSAETLALVRESFPETPDGRPRPIPADLSIIAVTAHTMIGDRERFLSHGVDYYISKPIMAKELNEVLRAIPQRKAD